MHTLAAFAFAALAPFAPAAITEGVAADAAAGGTVSADRDVAEGALPVCPAGDSPAAFGGQNGDLAGALDVVDADSRAHLVMHEGYGVLVLETHLTSSAHGPAAGSYFVPLPERQAVVVGATVAEAGQPPRAITLDDVGTASDRFEEYRRALELGVAPEQARSGFHGAAVLVSSGGGAGSGSGVDVAVIAPCSVREVTVRITMKIASTAVDGGWQLEVPAHSVLDVGGAFPMRVAVAGVAAMRGAPVRSVAPDDTAFDVVTVRPLTGLQLRTRGYVNVVTPLALAVPVDPDAESVPPAPDGAPLPTDAAPVLPVVVARAELDLPKPLAEAPAGLRFVFVVDASVSVGAQVLAKEWQLVDEILDAAPPDAKYAVITCARRPKVVVPAWAARAHRAAVTPPMLEVSNGSDLPAALKLAHGIAADVGNDEVPRVIVLSDMQMKVAVDEAALARAFSMSSSSSSSAETAPLTHAIVMAEDANVELPLAWTRSFGDDDPRAAGVEHTGGIWIETGAGGDDESALAPHLIKPTRLDRPRVTLAGVDVLSEPYASDIMATSRSVSDAEVDRYQASGGLPDLLLEGSGFRVEAALSAASFAAAHVRDLRVEGLLWATPLHERVKPDDALFELAAVDTVGAALDDALVRSIATRTTAVSRVTSLVEVPAWRPEQPEPSGYGTSCCGCGCCCGCGGGSSCHMGVGQATASHDLHELEILGRFLADDARACMIPRATLAVEVGDLEILDVTGDNACVVERFWTHRLDRVADRDPAAFHAERTFAVATPEIAR